MEQINIKKGSPIGEAKIIIKGVSEAKKLYKVDINQLYYNEENGRIATFMAEYNSTHDEPISTLSTQGYNNQIMEYMKKSESSESYKKTKNNIKSVGQMLPGIVLTDGRVIDGNRRFTFLRDLYEETKEERFKYFTCFVLDSPKTVEDRLTIKAMELMAQYGTDEKVAYSPVDRLADIYKDLVSDEKLFTPEEYVSILGNTVKINEIKKLMVNAQTMWDYLDFLGFRNRWDIARDNKLDGPIVELTNLRRKIKEKQWEEDYHLFFLQMKNLKGDRTRNIRKLIRLYYKDKNSFDKAKDKAFSVALEEENHKNNPANDDNEKITENKVNLDKYINAKIVKTNLNEAREKQLRDLKRALKIIEKIDRNELKLSDKELKEMIGQTLDKILKHISHFKNDVK